MDLIELRSADLALEFRSSPFGVHSPNLQYLLHSMRQPGNDPFHVLLIERPGRLWRLAIMTPGSKVRPRPCEVLFTDLAAAEWHVFKIRWKRMFGEELDIS